MNLPEDLQAALGGTTITSSRSLAHTAEDLSKRYRAGHARSEQTFLRSKEDVLAYAAYRLPATFAATYAALIEVRNRRPDWYPRTVLDVGAGPGTALWAAATIWPELEHATLLERDQHMIAYGKELAAHAYAPAVREAVWQQVDLTGEWQHTPCDLVIGSYMLGELPLSTHKDVLNRLWACSTGILLLIEPGTPRGYSLIIHAREQLLAAGATTIAPCPHDCACPLPANDWCHFAQRIARTRLHRTAKGASLSYEDEKFSYVALSRPQRLQGLPISGRVIRHPQKRSGHIHLELCTPHGLEHSIVTRSDRNAFRKAQELHWGAALSDPLSDGQS